MATMNTIGKVLDTLPDDIRKSNIESLTYLKYLMTVTNTTPKRWDIFKLFGGADGNPQKLFTERNELNKRFMEKLTEQKARQVEASDEALSVLPQLVEAIDQGMKNSLESRKQDMKYKLERVSSQIQRYHEDIARQLKQAADLQREMARLEGENPTQHVKDELEAVLRDGYWTNPIVEGNYLYLNTQEEIILTQKNKAANIDIELNVGKLGVKIDMRNFHLYVIPYKNNVAVGNTSFGTIYHPHVSGEGAICWGDASGNVAMWQAGMNLGKILKMLYSLLFTYSDSNPYVTLRRMKDNARRKGRTTEFLRHPERKSEWKAKQKAMREAAEAAEVQAPAEEVVS